jgi:integral membrane protein
MEVPAMELLLPSRALRLSRLRLFCLLEAATLLVLLLVAVPMKHLAGLPWAVSLMGPLHGLVFLGFCWKVVNAATLEDVSARMGFKLVLFACLPGGGFHSWKMLDRGPAA